MGFSGLAHVEQLLLALPPLFEPQPVIFLQRTAHLGRNCILLSHEVVVVAVHVAVGVLAALAAAAGPDEGRDDDDQEDREGAANDADAESEYTANVRMLEIDRILTLSTSRPVVFLSMSPCLHCCSERLHVNIVVDLSLVLG